MDHEDKMDFIYGNHKPKDNKYKQKKEPTPLDIHKRL